MFHPINKFTYLNFDNISLTDLVDLCECWVSVFFRFLAVFQVQEVDRKVEEIKAVISVYCLSKSVFRVPSYGQKTVWS